NGISAFFSYGSQFYATGAGTDIKIYKSIDNGATWNETSLTVEGDPLSYNAEVQGFEKHGDMIFADIGYGFAFSADGGDTWTARKLASDGKVVGWPNNFIRYDNWSYQILNSTDNGASWTLTTDGFPILAGIIQYAGGLGMVNGRVYVLNTMESGDLSEYPGYYYYIDNGSTSWTPAASLGQIPWDAVSIDGTSETDLYVSTFGDGVWTNAGNTGVEDAAGANHFISVYPNPATDMLYVDCEFTGGLMSIMDFTGRVISQTPFVNNRQQVNISRLKTGMYIISIDGFDKRYQSKFIKQ
ncbi:MAG: T9SS type A sorting domain-containing protein, partial [Bacteroidales bacterium]|nr:T9SS type A sorting domain-containing protein [Bacteroidales bacterium]